MMKAFKDRAQHGYYCTWLAQNYIVDRPEFATRGARAPRNMINAETLFGEGGIARQWDGIRRELLLVLDDGWDVPYETEFDKTLFGSLEVDTARFPFAVGRPEERLKALSDKVKSFGWKGMGIWVAAQRCGVDGQRPFSDADKEYWRERILWSKHAGVAYWKVDWGANEQNARFRRFLTEAAAELYPELVIEHAICLPPFNGARHDGSPVLERFADIAEYAELSETAVGNSEVFRTYDVSPALSVATTLDRAARLLPHARGYLNVEDELYIAAALGCQFGIMRSALGKGADAWDDSDRLREAEAAVAWQKTASPFIGGSVNVSDEILTDAYEFADGEMWFAKVNGKIVRQSAPSAVARNCELPETSCGRSGLKPFTAAALHPSGAYSAVVLPRTVKGVRREYVGGEVRFKCGAASTFALFGNADRVTFECENTIGSVSARCLLGGGATDLSHTVLPSRKGFSVDGETIRRLNVVGDKSAPAVVFEAR